MYSLKEEKISQITPFSVLADNKRIRNKIIDGKSTQATRSGKNLFDASKISNSNIIVSDNGKTITMPIATSGNGYTTTNKKLSELCSNLKVGDTVYLYGNTTSNHNKYIYIGSLWHYNRERIITQEDLDAEVILYGNRYQDGETEQVILTNFRIVKNIDDEWEQNGASPSPEFPSEIKSVGDDVNILENKQTTQTINDVLFTINEDKSITIKGTATANILFYLNNSDLFTEGIEKGSYALSGCDKGSSSTYYLAVELETADNGQKYINLTESNTGSKGYVQVNISAQNKYRSYIYVRSGAIVDTTIYPKLQKGTVATPYSEYGKGTVTIEQRGKNLVKFPYVDTTKTMKGITFKVNDDGTVLINGTATALSYLILSNTVDYGEGISGRETATNGTYAVPKTSHDTAFMFYNPSNKTLSLNVSSGVTIDNLLFKPILIKGTSVTQDDYEPYFSKDYVLPVSAPLRSLPNGTKDTIEEDGTHRRVGSVVLDGSDDETYGIAGEGNITDGFSMYTTFIISDIKNSVYKSLLCNYFEFVERNNLTSSTKNFISGGADKSIVLNIDRSLLETKDVAGFKKWLSANPITVDYELAEEVVEPFTEEQQAVLNSMKTFEGTNHFSLIGDLQTTLTFDYNPKITEEIKRAFKYNITKAYLEVAATDKASGFQINEDNYLQSIDFDDCRYIEGEGIIGSCVAKELQGKFVNVDTSFDIENRELECFIGAETEDNITHYLRLGTFIVQKPENDNVKDNTSFDSLDYMIKFNKEYVHRMAKYLKTKDTDILQDKQYYILTESGAYEEVIVPNKEELSTYYELIDEYTLMQLLKDICEQCEVKLGTFNFRNANYLVHGNRFDTGTTCRDVLKAISQAAFSWARINEYNELLLDFETSDTITEEIDYNEYYNLSFNDNYGPVNTIVLKNSQVEGENITVQDETLVKNYGIKELAILDNPFAYSEETRKAIIEAGKMLYGFTYVPLTVETIGAAYLNCKDKIKVKNMQDGDLETYVFDTKISYQGTLKSNVETLAMTDTETKYRYDGSLTTAQRRTEFRVDKAEQKITSLVKATTVQEEKLTEAVQDLDGFKRTITDKTDKTAEKVTAIEETVNGLVTEKSISGGQNLIKNSVGYFGNDYWQINETTEGKVLNDNSTDVKQNSISGSALKLQAETIYQDIKEIKNGEYYLSFNYKRIINTAIATLKVNDLIINLTEENWKEEAHLINVTTNNIRIEITTDLNSSILITDLMLTEGNIKVSWTQNANESYTDTVQIGKGVRITATGSDTEFVAEATGITINNTETGGKVAEFTKYGTETQELVAHKDVKVADSLLIQKIGNQTWFSSL